MSLLDTEFLAQPFAHPVDDQGRLPFGVLDSDETHRRPTDGFGVGAVVLVALPVRGHKTRRHATYRMAELLQFAHPVVRTRAGFQTDAARSDSGYDLKPPAPTPCTFEHCLAALVDAMHSEYTLCQANAESSNLHDDSSSHDWFDTAFPIWHIRCLPSMGGHFIRLVAKRSKEMFFIFGMPRSGTTLLAQCLNAHTNIVVPHETDFIIPMAFVFDRIRDERLGRELIYKLIVNSMSFKNSLEEYIGQSSIYDAVYYCEYDPASRLNSIYAKVAESSGAKLAGDKSPNDLNFLRMLVKTGGLTSSMKVIHIVRDIRDLMVSINRAGWASDLDLYFPRFWCNNNLYLNAIYQNNRSNYSLIRYEDLAADPQKEIEKLCVFMGVEFEPGMLLPENRHQRYKGNEVHSNLYNAISDSSVGKYRTALDSETMRNYET